MHGINSFSRIQRFETLAGAADREKSKRDDLVKALKDNGLELACLYGSAGMIDKGRHGDDIEQNIRWAEFAADNGVKLISQGEAPGGKEGQQTTI